MRKFLPFILGTLTIVAVLGMFPKYSYNDPDTFWHIELGRYMLEHGVVLHHAIDTYAGDRLPYVPHEFGFQIAIAFLYDLFGWPGIYLLTAVSLFMLIAGLYRLTEVSRKEMGLPPEPPALVVVLVLAVAVCVYCYYFTSRPQMVSAGLVVWYFVYLREWRFRSGAKDVALLLLLSVLIANVHAGVWPVIACFTGMSVLEDIAGKRWTVKRMLAYAAVLASGLANPGGWRSILYILTVTRHHYNLQISEWNPIAFASLEDLPRMLALLAFAAFLPFSLHRKLFRYLLMLGVLYLGVSNYKQNLFLWLFLPYFAATAIEAYPKLAVGAVRHGKRLLLACAAFGLALQTGNAFLFPTGLNSAMYPVQEMTYILGHTPEGVRPKVMSSYGSSGYVMFRGGDVLCDGRQDPFITDASRSAYGWNAFERSMFGFSERLPEIVRTDRPDYVIAKKDVSELLLADWTKRYGEPVFKGNYGSVYRISGLSADGS